jgi:hypothetical protein
MRARNSGALSIYELKAFTSRNLNLRKVILKKSLQ